MVVVARQVLSLVAGGAIDEWLLSNLRRLRQEHTLARALHLLQQQLWPGGAWFQTLPEHQLPVRARPRPARPLAGWCCGASRAAACRGRALRLQCLGDHGTGDYGESSRGRSASPGWGSRQRPPLGARPCGPGLAGARRALAGR
jgi:hypothetical protein